MKLIPLTLGKFAQVDDADYEWLMKWKWHAQKSNSKWYAKRRVLRNRVHTMIRMHRFILDIHKGDPRIVDHKDGDGINNQRENLRIATHSQNQCNTGKRNGKSKSKYKGVAKGDNSYVVMIRCKDINIKTKGFPLTPEGEIEAAKKYDELAKELHGEFAYLNFPEL